MRILGIDPGTYNMGVGVVDSRGSELDLVHVSVLTPRRSDPLPARLNAMRLELDDLLSRLMPGSAAIEEPFVGRNVRAAIAVGQAQAVALMACAAHGLDVKGYTPRQVKLAVTDYGGSSKEQVQEMVRALLEVDEIPGPSDAADALAVAICHANASRALELDLRE